MEDKIGKLKALKDNKAEKAAERAKEEEKIEARRGEIIQIVKRIEKSLPTILGDVIDSEAVLTENRTYLTLEWFLLKNIDGEIKILYTETPTERAIKLKTKYVSKREERNIDKWNLDFLEQVSKRLPAFVDILLQEAKK